MKRIYLLFLGLVTIMGIGSINAQTILFNENFAGGIPATWTNTSIPAWTYTTVGSDLGEALTSATAAGGYVMFDSDFYGAGVHNADLITSSFVTTGQTTVRLQFQELFRQYGTSLGTVSVRKNNGAWNVVYTIGTGMAQDDVTNNPNLVDIDISTFASNSTNVQLKFNFTGNYDYWWMLDDIFVYSPPPYDVAIDSFFLSPYSAVPLDQVAPITPAIGVANIGGNTATNLTVNVNIYDGTNAVVFNTTMNQASIASGATTNLTSATSFIPTSADFYLAEYIITINETDADLSNDTIYTAIDVTDSLFAKDFFYLTGNQNILDGPWFLGASNDGQAGNVFTAEADAELVSAVATFNGAFEIGDQTQANLYSVSGGTPGALIASSPVLTVTQADTPVVFYEFFFPAGTNLTAGNDYLITVQQNAASSARFGLYSATSIYTPNTSFIQINGGAWQEIAAAGVGNQTFMIRANVYTPYVPQDCGDLIISEIVEGGGSNKCIELYNPTATPIDLSAYSINVYNNGGTSPNTNTPLAGTVPAMGTFVICNSASNATFLALADATTFNNAVSYNGNDVVELLKGTDVIDIIGEIGNSANFNQNMTLVRNEDVLVGDLDGSNAFDVSVWASFPQDYDGNLGTHYSDCNPICHFDSLVAGTQTPCVNTTNKYTQEVTVYFSNPPATGMLNVNGQTFAIGASPQTVTLTGLDSDGLDVDVVAFFTDDNACTFTETALFTAPATCLCPSISVNVTTTSVTTCTTPDGTATAAVTGGAAPYTYAWTPSTYGTTATITGLPSGSYSVIVTDDNGCVGNGSASVVNASGGLTADTSSTLNPSCFMEANGEIHITASNGTAPYSYAWSDLGAATASRNDLSDGSYSVVVTDAGGCTVNLGPYTLTQPTELNVAVDTVNNASCNGLADGVLEAIGSGGTAPYDYQWSNGVMASTSSNLLAGNYIVYIEDANGCKDTSVLATITEPLALVVSTNAVSDVSCNGLTDGTIDMSVSGGTTPYTYAWTGSTATTEDITVGAGNYTLTVTDANGCIEAGTQETVNEPSAIVITIDNSTDVTCNGANDGEINTTISGGTAPYTNVWTNSTETTDDITGLSPNDYTLTVTDASGCSASSTLQTIAEPAVLTATGTTTPESTTGAADGTATVLPIGGTAPYNYVWDDANSQTTATATGLIAGNYTVSIFDANGCAFSVDLEVDLSNGIKNVDLAGFMVYPNPTTKNLTVSFDINGSKEMNVKFFNTIGKEILSEAVFVNGTYSKTFNVSDFAAGIYFLEISSENGKTIKKFTVNK